MVWIDYVKRDDSIPTPRYAHCTDSGFDLSAQFPDKCDRVINPGEIKVVPTGLFFQIPTDLEGQIRPRSSMAIKHGITVANTPGTLDASYRGEVMVGLINLSDTSFIISNGDRIAQMVIAPVEHAIFLLKDSLKETARGEGRFGSTGATVSDLDNSTVRGID